MYKSFFKRFFDIVISLIAMPFFAIVFIIIAPIIYFTDRGSVFYCGERIGKNGKTFKMYKFRSMRINAPDIRNSDGTTYNSENDDRLTKIGKFIRKTSLDETPQIFNILKGEMSLIGPRPITRTQDYTTEELLGFLSVRPGITGFSQAYFRNGCEVSVTIKNDMYYAQNISFAFDLKILFKTFFTVFAHKNIYRNDIAENITAEKSEVTTYKN